MEDSGIKYDEGKPKLSLIPLEGLVPEAQALTYGMNKYGKNNYKLGMEWSRVLDAALRHLNAFAAGENLDKESKIHHLGHCKANLSMLLYYIEHGLGKDDR
jgi:hypothetical protein